MNTFGPVGVITLDDLHDSTAPYIEWGNPKPRTLANQADALTQVARAGIMVTPTMSVERCQGIIDAYAARLAEITEIPEIFINDDGRPFARRFILDQPITTKETAMANTNPLTSKDARLVAAWRGKAQDLSQNDIGRVVRIVTVDGAEVKDVLTHFIVNYDGLRLSLQHVQMGDDRYSPTGYARVAPDSKVTAWDVEWKEEF